MTVSWKTISGNLQGDVSYSLRKSTVTPQYIDFDLIAFSEMWSEFDLAFEYRRDDSETWKTDAYISQTTANYLTKNHLYGLTASKSGESNLIRWEYANSGYLFGQSLQIRVIVLPRIRVFSRANSVHAISEIYGNSKIDFVGQSNHNCIGINQSGQYMCLGGGDFYIIDSLSADELKSSSSSSYEEYYILSGSLIPDVTGNYYEYGVSASGSKSYKLETGDWYLWFADDGMYQAWLIHDEVDVIHPPVAIWYSSGNNPDNPIALPTFTPVSPASGIGTLTLGS